MPMHIEELSVSTAIVGAGIMLILGMLTGTWKYVEMRRSPAARAPMYVDIAHRAALLYAAAMAVCALLAALSPLSQGLELAAVIGNFAFFLIATLTYVSLGVRRVGETQYKHRNFTTGIGTWVLIVVELGATSLLLVGAIQGWLALL